MTTSARDKSTIERLLDKGFFAPLGFVLTKSDTVDELAAVGRKQIAFSRSLGRAAIKGLSRSATPSKASTPEPAEPAPKIDVSVFGYDDLTAREITTLLAGCAVPQARWIQERELGGKNRVTVLRAAERAVGRDG